MMLFGHIALLLCGIFDVTLGSTVKPIHSMSLEEAVLHLNERVSLLENRETSDLDKKINQLETKITNIETAFINKQKDLSTKLQELEERTSKQKEDILNTLREMNTTSVRSFDEVSERLQNEKIRVLMAENKILMDVHQLQRRAHETFEKINNMKTEITNVSETGRIKTDMLQNEINATRDLVHSCVASQRDAEDAIRKNMSSVENLRIKLENSLFTFRESCINISCTSGLADNLLNLSRTTKSELQSIQSDLYPRITLLEGRSDWTNDITEIQKVLSNHTSEISSLNTRLIRVETACNPPCQNGGTCWINNTCSCTPLISGDRCQNDHSKCGLDLRNVGINGSGRVGGNSNNTPAWPWMASVVRTVKRRKIYYGGSVIHRNFILTAAASMYTGDWKPVKSSELKVRLGLTNLDDLTHLQEHNVRTIYIHPEFKPATSIDYDIALLELEKPIDYNLFIRPICLPPTDKLEDNMFYKSQSSAQAIGFGHSEVVSKSDRSFQSLTRVLKNIDLVIQPQDICNKSLEDDQVVHWFTDRMFCAAEEKSFTCDGDNGGPAMQSHLSEEGTRIWTQVGVISWRIGCGLKEEYGFFTHVQKLMPWVRATIEAAFKT